MTDCPPELADLLEVLYSLSRPEAELLTYLCDNDARISEAAEELGKDRSTVQRYVSTLQTAGLVSRHSESASRGRYYTYTTDKDRIKEKVRSRLESWEENKLDVLDAL